MLTNQNYQNQMIEMWCEQKIRIPISFFEIVKSFFFSSDSLIMLILFLMHEWYIRHMMQCDNQPIKEMKDDLMMIIKKEEESRKSWNRIIKYPIILISYGYFFFFFFNFQRFTFFYKKTNSLFFSDTNLLISIEILNFFSHDFFKTPDSVMEFLFLFLNKSLYRPATIGTRNFFVHILIGAFTWSI